jgi:predicted nucleic acid-binding protein
MKVVVADTGPLNYLTLIDAVDLLPKLFERITVPAAVYDELTDDGTPAVVRAWIAQAPSWLEVKPNPDRSPDRDVATILDEGERAAIVLAGAMGADLILMDDRDGVAFARAKGFAVTGTLGVLDLAAQHGLINLAQAFARLKATSFHYRQGLLCLRSGRRRRNKPAPEAEVLKLLLYRKRGARSGFSRRKPA